jgi:two-component system, sensor histidine kinase and response regulator
VLVNLVGNAVKFTERGEVVVRVERQAAEATDVVLHIVVRDTGVGVPAAKRDVIFDAFTQADSSTTRRFGGTGLGLAITKRLVQLMHGRIWLESDEGLGSAFHFTARFAVAAAPGSGAREPRPLDGLHVLIVDDNATSRRLLSETLAGWGLRPQVVEGGQAALAALDRGKEAGHVPELVVTDHEMPDVDGIALAGRMKADAVLAQIPIVMLSSSSFPHDQARARQVGVRGFLAKPVTPSELLDTIMGALVPDLDEVVEPAAEPARGSVPTDGLRLRVLVAEDNVVNQRVTAGLLQQRGHRVVVVPNGRAALVALEAQPFDLVLMDIEMPELDGFEATAAIRAHEHEIRNGSRPAPGGSAYATARGADARIPIVALTAHALKGMEERCLAAGMDGYVSKPIQPETLHATLARFAAAATVTPPATGPEAVDLAGALRTAGGDQALLADLMRLFLDDCPVRVAELRAAVTSGDPDHVQRAAHAIKGSVATFGARRARDLAADLERAGRERSLGDATGLLGALESELARVSEALRQESVATVAS